MSRLESYELTTTDLLACVGTLGTAAPYAWRHLQKSLTIKEGKWGHRIIAILESIPLGVGFLIGLVERIWVRCHPVPESGPEFRQEIKPLISRAKSILTEEDEDTAEEPERKTAEEPEEKPVEQPRQSEETKPVQIDFEPILPATDQLCDIITQLPKPGAIPPYAHWRQRALTIDGCARKALKNLDKARRHHILDDLGAPRKSALDSVQTPNYFDTRPLPQVEELAGAQALAEPLSFSLSHAERWSGAGVRASRYPRTPHIEDAHFAKMLHTESGRHGCYFGLFDGHGGSKVAQFAAKLCMEHFASFLVAAGGNTHQAFELLLEWVEEEIKKQYDSWKPGWAAGTTVVLGFIDSHTGIATVATLADAEVSLYTAAEDGAIKTLPLSPLLSWKDPKEVARTKIVGESYYRGRLRGELAVSRALGDCGFKAVSRKPKITQCRVKKGQIILAACDGLRENSDYGKKKLSISPEQHIAQQISCYHKEGDPAGRSLAEVLVASAEQYSTDDISAMAIVVG